MQESKRARDRLHAAYRAHGLALQEFDIQATMRAHLGPGPIPVTPQEEEKAAPFLFSLASHLERAGKMFRQSYDVGARARERRKSSVGASLYSDAPTPRLSALLDVLDAEGHNVSDVIDELMLVQEAVSVMGRHLRAVQAQNNLSASSLRALQVRRAAAESGWGDSQKTAWGGQLLGQ